MTSKTKKHEDEDEVEAEAPRSKTSAAKQEADGPTQLLNPLYNYGPPVATSGSPANGSSPAVNTGVVVTIAGGQNHTPPANTAAVIGKSGSPSEEIVGLYTPTLTTLTPATIAAGAANAAVVCTGTAFFAPTTTRAGSTVTVNGSPVPTTYTSATSISGTFPHSTATAGTVSVNVTNLGASSTTPRTFTYT